MKLNPKEIELCHLAGVSQEDAIALKTLTGQPLELLEIYADPVQFSASGETIRGISSFTFYGKGLRLVLEHYNRFYDEGKLLLCGETIFPDPAEEKPLDLNPEQGAWDKIFLVTSTNNPYTVIEAHHTAWPNAGITTTELIRNLKSWDRRYGLKIIAINFDLISIQITGADVNYATLVTEVHALSTETGTDEGDKEAIIRNLTATGILTLWWD